MPFSLIFFISSFFILRLSFKSALITGVSDCIGIILLLAAFSTNPQFAVDIQESSLFIGIIIIIGVLIAFFSLDFILCLFLLIKNPEESGKVKKKILDLSTKLTRVEVKEISERVKIDKDTVKRVMKEMVQNKKVYGKYFSTSKALVFNQKANISEIDNLMAVYRDWEEKEIGKKKI